MLSWWHGRTQRRAAERFQLCCIALALAFVHALVGSELLEASYEIKDSGAEPDRKKPRRGGLAGASGFRGGTGDGEGTPITEAFVSFG